MRRLERSRFNTFLSIICVDGSRAWPRATDPRFMEITTDTAEPQRGTAAADNAAKGTGGEAVAQASLTQATRWRVPVVTPPKPPSLARNPSLPTFVGLIILILTFFIVLTSISLHDKHKSDAAVASVQQAFSGNAVTTEAAPLKDQQEVARDYIAGLTDRIQSLVPLMGGKPGPAADHQVLWLPVELAFASGTATLDPVFPTVLREVVKSLAEIPPRFTPHLELRLCTTEPNDQLRARAVAIAGALAAEHAPMQQFALGVMACDAKRIGIAIALAPVTDESAP